MGNSLNKFVPKSIDPANFIVSFTTVNRTSFCTRMILTPSLAAPMILISSSVTDTNFTLDSSNSILLFLLSSQYLSIPIKEWPEPESMSPTSPDMDLPLLYRVTFKPYNLPETFPVSFFTVCTVFLGFLFACLTLIVCITSAFDVFLFFGENPVFLSLFFTILTLIENYINLCHKNYD